MTASRVSPVGYVDGVVHYEVFGWAWNPEAPRQRLEILLIENGVVVATQVADKYRSDLVAAGIGDGNYHFQIPLPAKIAEKDLYEISVVIGGEELTPLKGSPIRFDASLERTKLVKRSTALPERLSSYQLGAEIGSEREATVIAGRIARDIERIAARFGADIALSMIYLYLLQRPIDQGGLKTRKSEIIRGRASYADVVRAIIQSAEFKDNGCAHVVPPSDSEYPLKVWI